MSRPHQNRPFPGTLYDWNKIRPRHVFCFWCLCNSFDSDDEGWIHISKNLFSHIITDCIPVPVHNPTLILESLHEMGYIEFVRGKKATGYRDSTTDHYKIRVSLNAWDEDFPVKNKRYVQSPEKAADLKQFYRDRYAKRKAMELAKKQDQLLSTI